MIAYIFGETVVDAVRVHGEAKVEAAASVPFFLPEIEDEPEPESESGGE